MKQVMGSRSHAGQHVPSTGRWTKGLMALSLVGRQGDGAAPEGEASGPVIIGRGAADVRTVPTHLTNL